MSQPGSVSYHFGGFTLNANERELFYLNDRVALNDRDLDVRLYMIRNPLRPVEAAELIRNVRGENAHVDDGNVRHHIGKIRKALDCDRRYPTFIETLPKRGYRFIAKVTDGVPANFDPDAERENAKHEFLITAHLFAPIYLGAESFESMNSDTNVTKWVRYKERESEEGRLCIFPNGIAVWHLRKTMRFPSMSMIARWRRIHRLSER